MIKSFRSKSLERFWIRNDARGRPQTHIKRLNLRMTALDEALEPEDMDQPGWHFHALAGAMRVRFSVRVTGNWRLTFARDRSSRNAVEVDYEDFIEVQDNETNPSSSGPSTRPSRRARR